ncbi:MAG: hypothetical protein NZ561_09230, partial [Phycisphaerae bacterium]|nr:hypothetical protein [Phycisphaerae bacterium]
MRRSRISVSAIFAAAMAAAPTTFGNSAADEVNYIRGAIVRPDTGGMRMFYRVSSGGYGVLGGQEGGVSGTWVGGGGGPIDSFIQFAAPSTPPSTAVQDYDLWNVNSNWSGGAFPTGGGHAFIGQDGLPTDLERLDDVVIYQNVDITLDRLTLANSRGVDITTTELSNPRRNLTADPAGLLIEASRFFPEPVTLGIQNPGFVFFGQTLQTNIVGSGRVTLDALGVPTSTIMQGNNSFSGGLVVRNGAMVSLSEIGGTTAEPAGVPQLGDISLGAGGASVTLDGGTIRGFSNLPAPTLVSINRPINIAAGGGTIQFGATTPPDITGPINGVGTYNQSTRGYGGTYVYLAANGLTGHININTGTMNLREGGTFVNVPVINNFGGTLRLDNTFGPANRLSDNANYRGIGSEFILNFESETIGTFTAAAGMTALTYQAVSGGTITANLARESGVLVIRGTNFGSASRFIAPNASSVAVGGGGAPGTTTRSIVPWVITGITTGSVPATFAGGGTGTFVGPDSSGTNLTGLNLTTEYVQNSFTGGATTNVNVTANVAGTTATINSLRIGSPTNSP